MTHAALKDLLPCPFCGCATRIQSNRDWHRLTGDHDETCMFVDTDAVMTVPATDECRLEMVAAWNRRAALSAMEGEAAVEILGWKDNSSPRLRFLTKVDRLTAGTILYTAPPAHQPGEVVTDEMVELGLQAAIEVSDARLPRYSVVRAIITAALAPKED